MANGLVLGGGSILGAFQVGVIAAICEQGATFSSIYGVSVGALNLVWLADRVGRARRAGLGNEGEVWRSAAADLEVIWREEVTGPEALGEVYSLADLARDIATGQWKGIMHIGGLARLIGDEVTAENIRASGLRLSVGATDVQTGAYVPVTFEETGSAFLTWVIASALTPVIMETITIDGRIYTDGGLRHVVPVADALRAGEKAITVVACQQLPEDRTLGSVALGSLPAMIFRTVDIMSMEIVENDLAPITGDPRHTIYRPPGRAHPNAPTPLERVNDLSDFTAEQVRELIDHGREVGGRNRV